MDSEAIRKKRQDDIEAKRKRLEEMRRSRKESAASTPPAPVAPVVAPVVVPPAKTEKENKAETEELVNSLLTSLPVPKIETPPAEVSTKSREELLQEKLKSFSTVKSFNVIDIIPASIVKYEKSTQTEEEDRLFLLDPSEQNMDESGYETADAEDDADVEMKTTTPGTTPAKGFKSPTPGKALVSNSKQQPQIQITSEMETEASFQEKAKVKLLPEECTRIISNKKFEKFLQTSTLYVERAMALTEEHDVIRDFMVDDSNAAEDDEHSAFILPPTGSSSATNATGCYEEDQLVGRPVMALEWSHLLPGLFLAAYGSKTTSTTSSTSNTTTTKASSVKNSGMTEEEAPGIVCVWDRDMHGRPEFRLTASSPVLAAVFHSHEKNLVLGGCYSGQILLWDTRLNKSLPVQRSSMSGKGHKHPVYAIAMTSSAVAAELVSVSTDGMLCHWDAARLAEPVSVVQLHMPTLSTGGGMSLSGFLSPVRDAPHLHLQHQQQNPLNISAMAFGHSVQDHSSGSAGDSIGAADLIFGCGSGQLVRTPLPYKDNHPNAAKVDAHFGFITALEPHPSRSNKYKHLLLSSSLDWTVKLWDLRTFGQPIVEFFSPSYDYVCDVQWSPVHPAVFVTVTSGGRIALWNLSRSTTEPADTLCIIPENDELIAGVSAVALSGRGEASTTTAAGVKRALTKVVWARDGLTVICGDSHGSLHMLRLHPAAALPSAQDESRLEMAIVSRTLDHTHNTTMDGANEKGSYIHQQSSSGDISGSLTTTPKKSSEAVSTTAGGSLKNSDSELSLTLE